MYLLVETKSYSTKNKLQKAIYLYLKNENRTAYQSLAEVKKAIEVFKGDIETMTEINPKCNPLKLRSYKPNDTDITIGVADVIYLTFYKSKEQ